MNDQFSGVDFIQNSYRASEFENNFDRLATFYAELLDGNDENVNEAIQLIEKYWLNRDNIGFSE